MANSYEDIVKAEWQKFSCANNKPLPNILLLGETGCGKSSLINLIFHKKLAAVNDIMRGTDGFQTYRGAEHGMGVNLIDSRGYEMGENEGIENFSSYYESIKSLMKESQKKDPLEKIHIIWFCISVPGEKIQDYDTRILKLLLREPELRSRVSVILTKCDEDDEEGGIAKIFKEIINTEVGNSVPVFEVSTEPNLKLDLEKMINWSANQLDNEDLKEAFITSQIVSLEAKRKAAIVRVGIHAIAASGIGLSPIPMSDAFLLVPLQIEMSINIIHLYGMENFAGISAALIGDIVISNLGKAFAGGLIKLIPVIGTWIGGVINATVAALITSALGWAISEICFATCKKIAKGEYVDMSAMFDVKTVQKYTQEYLSTHKSSDI